MYTAIVTTWLTGCGGISKVTSQSYPGTKKPGAVVLFIRKRSAQAEDIINNQSKKRTAFQQPFSVRGVLIKEILLFHQLSPSSACCHSPIEVCNVW